MQRVVGSGILTILLLGSSVALGAPRIIDTIGKHETEVRVHSYGGDPAKWAPAYTVLVEFADYASEDVLLVQWTQGKKKLGKPAPCAAKAFVKQIQSNPTTPTYPVNVAWFECRHPESDAIAAAGSFGLGLTYKQTLQGSTHDLGALSFEVMELRQGAQNNPSRVFRESHDHRLGLAMIAEATRSTSGPEDEIATAYFGHHDVVYKESGASTHLVFRFWTKFDPKGPRNLNMSCLLGGKKVAEGVTTSGDSHTYWTYRGKDRENGEWTQQTFDLYRLRTRKSAQSREQGEGWFYLGQNPGEYRCVAMADGEIIKELHFTVNAEGQIVNDACQQQVSTLRNIHVVRATDGKHASLSYDKGAGKSAFFGRVVWKGTCPPR